MADNFRALPPHKRFRLMHENEKPAAIDNTLRHNSDSSPPSCLPAKKRKQPRSPDPFPANSISTATYCLPAKKRITAINPNLDFLPEEKHFSPSFDLNQEYNPESDISNNPVTKKAPEEEEPKQEEEEEEEDGIMCAVCQSTDGDPSDPIVFCDGCDLMVHVTCYGKPLTDGVPEGDWFCSKCQLTDNNNSKSEEGRDLLICCLCGVNDGGALKPTTNNSGRWAHIVCALFVPEVFFRDPEGREWIDCSRVPSRRFGKRCYICEKSNVGCVIDCSEEKCGLGFHVTCGLKEDVCIEYKEGGRRNKGVIVAGFCKGHSDLWMKQQATGKYKIVARSEDK